VYRGEEEVSTRIGKRLACRSVDREGERGSRAWDPGEPRWPGLESLFGKPTLPDAIHPKDPFGIAQMAVGHHIRDTIDLQH
jgi:hypothetical protein